MVKVSNAKEGGGEDGGEEGGEDGEELHRSTERMYKGLDQVEGLKQFYNEDFADSLDVFVYSAVSTSTTRKYGFEYQNKHGFPPTSLSSFFPNSSLVFWLRQIMIMLVVTLVQLGGPAAVIIEKLEEAKTIKDSEKTLELRIFGTAIMLLMQLQLCNDFLSLGAVYIAPNKLHLLRIRVWALIWGLVVNFGSIYLTQAAVFFCSLATTSVADFIMNFAALFVIYHLDDYALSALSRKELSMMFECLKKSDLNHDQDRRHASQGVFSVVRVAFILLLMLQVLLVGAIPIAFACIY
jgi:hypothetical protein